MHAAQCYMCKGTTFQQVQQSTPRGHRSTCKEHWGAWSWHLQRQVWQLDTKLNIVTRALPRDTLELADLINLSGCDNTAQGTTSRRW